MRARDDGGIFSASRNRQVEIRNSQTERVQPINQVISHPKPISEITRIKEYLFICIDVNMYVRMCVTLGKRRRRRRSPQQQVG